LEIERVNRDHYGKRLMRKAVGKGFTDYGPSISGTALRAGARSG
jgi:hypothetical protein